MPIGVEETNDALRLLERLDQPVQQDAIEAAVMEPYAVPVMIIKGVHRPDPLLTTNQQGGQCSLFWFATSWGYQGRSPWLVSFRWSKSLRPWTLHSIVVRCPISEHAIISKV